MPQINAARPRLVTADEQISTDPIRVSAILLVGGSDAATITIYNEGDSSKTAAKRAVTLKVVANTSQTFQTEIYLQNGCYADISGTDAVAYLYIK